MTTIILNDCELVDHLRAGDSTAFEQVVRSLGGRLLAVAHRYLRSEDDCHDVVQDTFVSAFRSVRQFAGKSSLATWLHRILVNHCLMKLRTQSRRHEVSIEDFLPKFDETGHHTRDIRPWRPVADNLLEQKEIRVQVRECIQQLPDDYRTVLVLRDIEQFDTDETARMLKTTPGAVKTRLHRARQALRTLLEPMFVESVGEVPR
jgi:RNA polymerase sigma-70 factor (ECF subfamily)